MSAPDPGWYPDPADPAAQRWWDGTRWTEHTSGAASAVRYTVEPDTGTKTAVTAIIAVVLVAVLLVVGGAVALVLIARDDTSSDEAPSVEESIVPTTAAPIGPGDEGSDGGTETPATDAADMTACQTERATMTTAIQAAKVSSDASGTVEDPGTFLNDPSAFEYYTWTGDSPETWTLAPIGNPPC